MWQKPVNKSPRLNRILLAESEPGAFERMAAPMQRAEQGLEWLVLLVIAGSGVALGVFASSWTNLGIGAVVAGVLLNAALLSRVALATGNADRLVLAVVGSVPAGVYDALKILSIGLAVRLIIGFLSASVPLGSFLLLQGVIVAIVFLLSLNEFLRGAKKVQLDIVLGLTWVGLLIVAFVAFGWQGSMIALLLSFVYGTVFRPVSVRLAAKLLSIGGGTPGRHVGLPPGTLAAISREVGRELNRDQAMHELLSGRGRREKAEEALLDYCEADRNIRAVMAQFKVSRDALGEIYSRLLAAGAGQWAGGHYVAASAIAYPDTLRYVLSRPVSGREALLETAYRLIMHFERGAPLE